MAAQSLTENSKENDPKFSILVDNFIRAIGHGISWLSIVLIVVILLQIILRYVFGMGQIFLEEAQWHLYAVVVMFGVSYGVVEDTHIRMDLIYGGLSHRKKEWIEIFAQVFFVMPFAMILFLKGVDLVGAAWRVNEGSASPGGIPWRWAIKSVLPISMAFYFLAAVSRTVRAFYNLFIRRIRK
jgi:TRAP-type mannitol/chloroaromatic compound transport system permease small subunit